MQHFSLFLKISIKDGTQYVKIDRYLHADLFVANERWSDGTLKGVFEGHLDTFGPISLKPAYLVYLPSELQLYQNLLYCVEKLEPLIDVGISVALKM